MYIDPLASSKVLLSQSPSENAANAEIVEKTANAVTALQIVREMSTFFHHCSKLSVLILHRPSSL
jgi:hypothetical protein